MSFENGCFFFINSYKLTNIQILTKYTTIQELLNILSNKGIITVTNIYTCWLTDTIKLICYIEL